MHSETPREQAHPTLPSTAAMERGKEEGEGEGERVDGGREGGREKRRWGESGEWGGERGR